MKFSTRFLTLLAAAAALFTGCRQEEADYDLPSIKIDGAGLTVDNETKKASFAADKDLTVINLSVTATRDWTALIDWDADEVPWIAVTPDAGDGTGSPTSAKITILENAGYNRAKQIKFDINYDYKTLYITQAGEKGEEIVGTLENPFTVAGVNKYVKTLGSDVQSPDVVYVKGIISQIADAGTFTEGGTFGNATFYISDDGSTNNQFYCYRILYLGNKKFQSGQTDIKVGDEVIVCGKVVNYKGNTPETVQGTAFLYELNGVSDGGAPTPAGEAKGTGTLDDPYNPAGAMAAVASLTWTDNNTYDTTGDVYVKGKISRIADNGTFTQGGTFGNASFYISEDGTSAGEFYCFRVLYLGNQKYQSGQTDIKVGDEVIICGQLMNYRGNTPETVAGKAYVYSLNGDTGGGVTPPGPSGEAKGTGTVSDPYNALGAANAVKNLTWTSNTEYDTTGEVYVKGKISRIADNGTFGQSGTFGNASFWISDDGTQTDEFYCYRILYLGNVKYTSGTDIKVGDEVVVCGQLMNYRGNTPETVAGKAYLYSLNDGGTPPGPDTGDVKAVTIAEFNAAPESDSQVYELVGTIGGTINATYGNFDLTDATGTVYVYGLTATELGYGAKNDKSYASLNLNEGDKIKIRGYRGSFGDKIEVMYAWFIEKVGGDTPGGDTGEVKAVSIAEFNAAPESDKQVYELVGTIGGTINATYGNFDLTDATGTVYVYGLTATELGYGAKNDKSYASLGLNEGDKIKIRGYRGSFGDKIEVMYAWFIEKVGGDTPGGDTPGGGTVDSPYTVAQALDAVKDLTWTSNTEYESTDEVYVKGKISRIASGGTFTEGGTYGNASFYISDDGTETNEFYCFRVLYLGNKKFEAGQTDIKVGDEVVICGKLMNYKGNTPETVSGKAYLYSLNSSSTPGGGDTPGGSSVSFATNADTQSWAAETDGTYGTGFGTTAQGLKLGYYKHTSTSNPVAPNANHVRVYKNSVLSIASAEGKKIKKIVIGCAPNAGTTSYCFDMTGLEGGASATADKSALTVTWTGSASKVVLHANNGQVRMEKISVEFE
ncbi:MAG: hypothetical protein IJP49_03405 [Bacteroidales bacterium]|nr:hypothetical protein [Bacteroidales bacterium]